MNPMDIFLTNLDQLEDYLIKISEADTPKSFNRDFLETLGISEPNSVLFIEMFKVFGLVDQDGKPVESYHQFAKSEDHARAVFAEKVKECYSDIYDEDPEAHQLPKEEIRDVFHKRLKGKKSETFIRMVADTYFTLASFADWEASPDELSDDDSLSDVDDQESKNSGKDSHTDTDAELDEIDEAIRELDQSEGESDDNDGGEDDFEMEQAENREETETTEAFQGGLRSVDPEHFTNGTTLNGKHKNSHVTENLMNTQVSSDVKQNLSKALTRRAELLYQLERYDEAINAYNQMISYYEASDEASSQDIIAKALIQKAEIHEKLEQHDEAISAYDKFINRYSGSNSGLSKEA